MQRERRAIGDDEGEESADEDDGCGDQRGARGARFRAASTRGPFWVCHGTPPFDDDLSQFPGRAGRQTDWPLVGTDLEAGTLVVNQTLQETYGELHFKEPKTAKSRRRITLPGLVVEALRAHRAEQAKKRLRREPGWTDSDLMLAAPHGGPWWPSNFDRIWRRFKKHHGIDCRFHDLRHTHATQLLKADVHPKVVSERLGHASIGITLDTYSHVMPGMQEEAAEKIDAGLRAALTG